MDLTLVPRTSDLPRRPPLQRPADGHLLGRAREAPEGPGGLPRPRPRDPGRRALRARARHPGGARAGAREQDRARPAQAVAARRRPDGRAPGGLLRAGELPPLPEREGRARLHRPPGRVPEVDGWLPREPPRGAPRGPDRARDRPAARHRAAPRDRRDAGRPLAARRGVREDRGDPGPPARPARGARGRGPQAHRDRRERLLQAAPRVLRAGLPPARGARPRLDPGRRRRLPIVH